jgi:hypothetical protein
MSAVLSVYLGLHGLARDSGRIPPPTGLELVPMPWRPRQRSVHQTKKGHDLLQITKPYRLFDVNGDEAAVIGALSVPLKTSSELRVVFEIMFVT